MKQIKQLVYLLTIAVEVKKSQGRKTCFSKRRYCPKMEQNNGHTFGKVALVQSQDQPRSED